MDLVYLRGVCNKLSFLNADTDRNRKSTAVYLLLVNLLRMCLWVDAGAWLCSFLCRRCCSAGPCMWFLTKSEKRKMRKRLRRILLMKNKTLKHYKRKKFFYRFFMRKSPRSGAIFGLAWMICFGAILPLSLWVFAKIILDWATDRHGWQRKS